MVKIDRILCGECGGCVAVCPQGALELLASGLSVNSDLCSSCENCVIFCPVGALSMRTAYAKAHAPGTNLKLKND